MLVYNILDIIASIFIKILVRFLNLF